MNYREVKRKVCKAAAEHLYSLEIYDEFDDKDEDRVDRAILEIQDELMHRARRGEKASAKSE